MGFGMSMKRWAHGKQHMRQVFNPDPRFAQLALEALEWCLLDRGIPLTEEIIEEARVESDKYPSITVKDFVEGRYNKKMQESLRGL